MATTYAGEIDSFKNWINIRLNWLDANMFGLCTPTTVDEIGNATPFVYYPNPATTFINANCVNGYQIYNAVGQLLLESNQNTNQIDISSLPVGVYVLKTGGQVGKFVKKE